MVSHKVSHLEMLIVTELTEEVLLEASCPCHLPKALPQGPDSRTPLSNTHLASFQILYDLHGSKCLLYPA